MWLCKRRRLCRESSHMSMWALLVMLGWDLGLVDAVRDCEEIVNFQSCLVVLARARCNDFMGFLWLMGWTFSTLQGMQNSLCSLVSTEMNAVISVWPLHPSQPPYLCKCVRRWRSGAWQYMFWSWHQKGFWELAVSHLPFHTQTCENI